MNALRTSRPVAASIALTGAALALALVASGVLGASSPRPDAEPTPSAPPASPSLPSPTRPGPSSPIAEPSAQPPETPRPSAPADDASDGIDIVDLFNWPGVESLAVVWDETGSLADAVSGRPDRTPVAYERLQVSQRGVDSIRLTWSDLPVGNRVRLTVRLDERGRYQISLFRPLPPPPTDGVVSNRVVDLRFHTAVDVAEIDVRLLQSMTPSGAVGFVQRGLAPSSGSGLSLAVWDETEGLTDARIVSVDGKASLEPDILGLENVGDATVRARWSDPEGFTAARLSIRMLADGRYEFRLIRERSKAPSAPIAVERVVDLDFHVHVVAEDVNVEVTDTISNGG